MGIFHIPTSGNALIDEGHTRLMEQLTEIGGLLRQSERRSEALVAFKTFKEDLRNHLGMEEIIMRSAGYAQLDSHARRHTALIDRIQELVDSLSFDPRVQPLDVHAKVSDLLYEHELVEDSDIWPCLSNQGAETLTAWDPALETGVTRIDDHHRAMVALLARLRAMPDGTPRDQVEPVIESLAQLTTMHFQLEESLWTEWGDSAEDNAQHARAHANLLETFGQVAPRLLNGDIPLSAFVNDFLAGWLKDHIQRTDQPHFRAMTGLSGHTH